MIPNVGHMVLFGHRPFSIVHYLATESFRQVNRPDAINFYYQQEPTGYWWEVAAKHLNAIRYEPRFAVGGRALVHPAHQADLARLEILYEYGGIYLDLDTICVRPFLPLRGAPCVMGMEMIGGRLVGLCNAVILAERHSAFLRRWLEGFDPKSSLWEGFRSGGADFYWNEYSVQYPAYLAALYRNEIRIESPRSFFMPSWSPEGLRELFELPPTVRSTAYCHHLWESESWGKYLKNITPQTIMNSQDMYSCLARRYL